MITRIWHGRTTMNNAEKYLQFLLKSGTKEYLQTKGNLSTKVWQKIDDPYCHFWTVTEWTDIEAVKSFAGEDYEKAKYYPEDDGILLEFEERVNHYESVNVSKTEIQDYIRQLEQLYSGGSWQSENFKDKLKDIGESDAFRQPFPGVHSIAEIVWHCIYWRTVLLTRLNGNKTYKEETEQKFNFLPLAELQNKGWNRLKTEFDESQSALIHQLNEKNDHFLTTDFQPGSTYDYLVEGIVQHDIYHLGQIGLVKKILSVKPAD